MTKLMTDRQLRERLAAEMEESREGFYDFKAFCAEHNLPWTGPQEWTERPLVFDDEWTPEDQKKYYAAQDAMMNVVSDENSPPLAVRIFQSAEALFGREWALHLNAYLEKTYYPFRPNDVHGACN